MVDQSLAVIWYVSAATRHNVSAVGGLHVGEDLPADGAVDGLQAAEHDVVEVFGLLERLGGRAVFLLAPPVRLQEGETCVIGVKIQLHCTVCQDMVIKQWMGWIGAVPGSS